MCVFVGGGLSFLGFFLSSFWLFFNLYNFKLILNGILFYFISFIKKLNK